MSGEAVMGSRDLFNEGVALMQQGVFSTIFCFFTTKSGKALLMKNKTLFHHSQPAQTVLFPLAALFELMELGSVSYEMYQAKNKNLQRSLHLAVTSAKTITVMTAIGIGAAATIGGLAAPTIVPILFTVALGLNTAYSMANTIYHLVRMYRAEKGSNLRLAHRKLMEKNLVGTLVGGMLTAAVVGLFVLSASTGAGLAVFSGVGILAMAVAIIVPRVLKKHRAKTIGKASNSAKSVNDTLPKNDRLYVRDLRGEIKNGGEEKKAFIAIIDEKSNDLVRQINNKEGFFAVSQKPKRLIKIAALSALKACLEKGQRPTKEEIDTIENDNPGIFQSFFRDTGAVENIFSVAKADFTAPEIAEEKTQEISL